MIRKTRATVNLGALVANYRRVLTELNGVPAAAVVKANAYGLGAEPVVSALWKAGCRRFFVARVDEGIAVRAVLPEAEINVFDGVAPGTAEDLLNGDLLPILNSLDQIRAWNGAASELGRALPAGLHIDTGMRRLGLPPDELDRLLADRSPLDGLELRHVLSHLASADVTGATQSADQLALFRWVREQLPMGTASLANSAGIFLGPAYHFDLARPGISLYGGSPFPDSGRPNPMRSVVTIESPILQIRTAQPGETVGYGATHTVSTEARIATVPVGYADGFLRSSSSRGFAAVGGHRVPIVGRVSMDLITIDVTGVAPELIGPGSPVELLGPNCPVDEVAELAGSIPHEFLTNLSRRFEIRYLGPED